MPLTAETHPARPSSSVSQGRKLQGGPEALTFPSGPPQAQPLPEVLEPGMGEPSGAQCGQRRPEVPRGARRVSRGVLICAGPEGEFFPGGRWAGTSGRTAEPQGPTRASCQHPEMTLLPGDSSSPSLGDFQVELGVLTVSPVRLVMPC